MADCSIFLDQSLRNFSPQTNCLFKERHRFWCQQSEDDGRKTLDGSLWRGMAADYSDLGRSITQSTNDHSKSSFSFSDFGLIQHCDKVAVLGTIVHNPQA